MTDAAAPARSTATDPAADLAHWETVLTGLSAKHDLYSTDGYAAAVDALADVATRRTLNAITKWCGNTPPRTNNHRLAAGAAVRAWRAEADRRAAATARAAAGTSPFSRLPQTDDTDGAF